MTAPRVLHLPDLRGDVDAVSGTGWQATAIDGVHVPSLRDARLCAAHQAEGVGPCTRRVVSFDPFDGARILSVPETGLRVVVQVRPGFPVEDTPILRIHEVTELPGPDVLVEGVASRPCGETLIFDGVFVTPPTTGTYRLSVEGYDGDAEIRFDLFRPAPTEPALDRCAITLLPAPATVLPLIETPPAVWPRPPLVFADKDGCVQPAWWVTERGWLVVPNGTNLVDLWRSCAGGVLARVDAGGPVRDAIVWKGALTVLLADRVLRFDIGGCPIGTTAFVSGLSDAVALGVTEEGDLLVVQRGYDPDGTLLVFRVDGSRVAAPGVVPGRGWYASRRSAAFTFDGDVCAYAIDPARVGQGCCVQPSRALTDAESLFFRLVDDLPGLRRHVGYPASGTTILGPADEGAVLDAGRPGVQWHRIVFFGDIPEGCVVDVETRASDELAPVSPLVPDGWSLALGLTSASRGTVSSPGDNRVAAGEALVLARRGRYLAVRLTLRGTGYATPRITGMEVELPREGIGRFLPQVFQASTPDDDFLRRWLALFEATTFDGIAARLDAYPELFDPRTAPDAMLPYLAGWVDAYVPQRILTDTPRLRRILIAAPQLAELGGTVDGIVLASHLYLDAIVQIVESFRTRSRFVLGCPGADDEPGLAGPVLGCDTILTAEDAPTYLGDARLGRSSLLETDDRGGSVPYAFEVLVPAHAICTSEARSMLEMLVNRLKPAHTTFCIRPIAPAGWVLGVASAVGQELGPAYDRHVQDPATYGIALLNGPPRPKPLGLGWVLGHDSRLVGANGPGVFRIEAIVGKDTRLGA